MLLEIKMLCYSQPVILLEEQELALIKKIEQDTMLSFFSYVLVTFSYNLAAIIYGDE